MNTNSYIVEGIGRCKDKDVIIPLEYKGLPVTSIGDFAFESCASLKSITIPEGVTSIGYCAFYDCKSLTRITIPSSVISIVFFAFANCSSLTIYCEAESKPNGWDNYWNYSNCPVVWGYKE